MRRLKSSRFWHAFTIHDRTNKTVTRSAGKDVPVECVAEALNPQPRVESRLEEGEVFSVIEDTKPNSQVGQLLSTGSHQSRPKSTPRLTLGNGRLPIELLQHIFSYLDFLSLSSCRFVCLHFRACLRKDFTTLHDRFLDINHQSLDPKLLAKINFNVTVIRFPLSAQVCTTDTYTATFASSAPHPRKRGATPSDAVVTTHPVLRQLSHALTLVHQSDGTTYMSRSLIRAFDDDGYNAEWKAMLAYVPPVARIMLVCRFRGGYAAGELGGPRGRWHLDGREWRCVVKGEKGRGVLLVGVVSALESLMAGVMRSTVEAFTLIEEKPSTE